VPDLRRDLPDCGWGAGSYRRRAARPARHDAADDLCGGRLLADRALAQLHPRLLLWSWRCRNLDGALRGAAGRGGAADVALGEPAEAPAKQSASGISTGLPSVSAPPCYPPHRSRIRTIAEDP